MKIFDLQTDFSFFFISLRGEPFESQFMLTGNETRRFTNEGRYNPYVNAIQLAAFGSCVLGTQYTFFDIYGTRQRLVQDVAAATKITIGVMLFEDLPQLFINIWYMMTVNTKNDVMDQSTDEAETNVEGVAAVLDFFDGVDTISIVSLVASIVSILYSIYLLISDCRVAARQRTDHEANAEEEQYQQEEVVAGSAQDRRAYKPSDSSYNNPTFTTTTTKPANQAKIGNSGSKTRSGVNRTKQATPSGGGPHDYIEVNGADGSKQSHNSHA